MIKIANFGSPNVTSRDTWPSNRFVDMTIITYILIVTIDLECQVHLRICFLCYSLFPYVKLRVLNKKSNKCQVCTLTSPTVIMIYA